MAGEHHPPTGLAAVQDKVLLQTERVYLRRFNPADSSLLFELDSDPEVMRFITKGETTSLQEIETIILPRILSYYARETPQGVWAAHLLENSEFIGWFHLRADKIEPAEMELGYRLKRSVWGQGIATEGSRALISQAFQVWNYPKVCARTLVGNLASQRVMEKAGLTFECDFVYSSEMIPGWSEEERRAVKYGARKDSAGLAPR